ncbi:MAG: Grx4 family monothiol glutaredoxin [Alphaproteobacteria bacterium]|nr:Grx4 family monothiol glutaredoxin [Alphaproteobacteria bacterium]OJV45354.1 MAG: monothiol glutaredoxin, Grx4 family [Alphaproteobacteria bacterium 43-37]
MDILDQIAKDIADNDVVLYMKGTPDIPMCGFSATVVSILNHMNVPFKGVNVLEDPQVRQGIKDFTQWPTIPQLYIKGEFIGGCDVVKELFQSGELESILQQQGLTVNA